MAEIQEDRRSERFAELIREFGDKAYNFAFRLAGNEQDARDLVQEAFYRAFNHIDKYNTSRPFGPWLNSILKNIYIDGLRRYEHKNTISMDALSPIQDVTWENIIKGPDQTPERHVDRSEVQQMVRKALDALPAIYKSAVILCDIEKYSYAQIGEILDCPIGTVRSRIHQGRLLLRRALEGYFRQDGVAAARAG